LASFLRIKAVLYLRGAAAFQPRSTLDCPGQEDAAVADQFIGRQIVCVQIVFFRAMEECDDSFIMDGKRRASFLLACL
jgi:hypothetical protein